MTDFQQEVIDRLGRIEEQNKTLFNRLSELERAVHGNGRPGLLTRVANLEVNWRWAQWIAGAVGAGIGFAVSFFFKQ